MQLSLIICISISLFNVIFFTSLLWKWLLSGSLELLEFIMFFLIMIFPGFNVFSFLYYSFVSIRGFIIERPIKKLSKEQLKITSLNILKEILSYYEKTECKHSNEEYTTESLNNCKKQIHSIINFIENNFKNSEVISLFLTYEVTLMRISTIIKESKNIGSNSFLEILLESKKTIDILHSEVSYFKQKLKTGQLKEERKACSDFIKEIEIEITHHQKRIKG